MHKLFAKVHNRQNRRGFSLIEVIVSMLILSIVVIPLVNNFLVVTRTNLKAREMKAATDFAQQIMETLQAYGADSVDAQFWGGKSYKEKGVTVTYPVTQAFRIVDGVAADDRIILQSDKTTEAESLFGTGDVRTYAISDAYYNGRSYDVRICYDPKTYGESAATTAVAFNINKFPDVSTLSKDSTAVINPNQMFVQYAVASGGAMDRQEYEYTSDLGKEHYTYEVKNSYESVVAEAYYSKYVSFHRDVLAYANSVLNDEGISLTMKDIESSYPDTVEKINNKKAAMQKWTERTTTIVVKDADPASGAGGEYAVESKILYDLTSATQIGNPTEIKKRISQILITAFESMYSNPYDESVVALRESYYDNISDKIDSLYSAATTTEKLHLQYDIASGSGTFDDLKSIYLMYLPLERTKCKSDDICIDIQTDKFNKGTTSGGAVAAASDYFDFYLVPQLGLLVDGKAGTAGDISAIQSTNYRAPAIYKTKVITTTKSAFTVTSGAIDETSGSAFDVTDESIEGADYEYTYVPSKTLFAATNYDMTLYYVPGYLDPASESVSTKDHVVSYYEPTDMIYQVTVELFRHRDDDEAFSAGEKITELTLSGN